MHERGATAAVVAAVADTAGSEVAFTVRVAGSADCSSCAGGTIASGRTGILRSPLAIFLHCIGEDAFHLGELLAACFDELPGHLSIVS